MQIVKILFYNMAYGTGVNGSVRQYIRKIWRFVWTPEEVFQNISHALQKEAADVICLAEVDTGSFRNRFNCQATNLASRLNAKLIHSQSKYHPESIWKSISMVRMQHDAVLSNRMGEWRKHHFASGMKKLIQEFIVEGISIFTVHLALLRQKVRAKQLRQLAEILKKCPRPYLVCGDFNLRKGLHELKELIQWTKAKLVETPMTFPSFKPSRALDLFLASPELKVVEAGVVNVQFSDHLPVWVRLEQGKFKSTL